MHNEFTAIPLKHYKCSKEPTLKGMGKKKAISTPTLQEALIGFYCWLKSTIFYQLHSIAIFNWTIYGMALKSYNRYEINDLHQDILFNKCWTTIISNFGLVSEKSQQTTFTELHLRSSF